jgi:hypothetical protein
MDKKYDTCCLYASLISLQLVRGNVSFAYFFFENFSFVDHFGKKSRRLVRAQVRVHAPLEAVWATLTD